MHRIRYSLALVAVFTAAAQIRPIDPAAIERAAIADLQATKTPGAAVVVVSGDRVIFSNGYGTASVDTWAPVRPDMLFRLGSTTKMFTAAAVASLAVEGRIDLDAPISRYIPGLDLVIGRLTANQLMSHTSGLRDDAVMFGSHDESALGTEIHAWKADFLFAPPGRIYSYSNPGFWLAGYLAETVSGKPYADVIEERLFRPLGMKRSTLRPTMAMTWPLAQGHEVKDGKPEVIRPAADNAANWPAGSIFSSALDLSRWVIAFMNDGKLDGREVLSPRVIAMMSNPHSHIPGGEATYGYGLTLEARQGLHWVEHGGSRAGYGSLISMVPEHKFAVIVLGNRTGVQLPKLADALRAALVAFQPELPKKPDTHPLEAAELKRYAGAYRNGTTKLVFSIDQGALVETGGAQKMRYARGGDGFLLSDARPGAEPQRVVVVPDSKGGVEFLFAGGRAFRRE